ncbi:N-terminal C2 in EEIG1 and EHBP1 proteins-domain-containing protein [Mycena alexandri]|uniref:N-terminal C2 in EEIG1 and EHBP1 proteins-domain-containing protein n=1 Tax=Mycena alexandri TaxID=1745969 RepID=A0AAD6SDE1_9AGAR|nr:N-terminal C2 in EEIG1 and EHBP1 proteins-domain-containing protein [Mycena alexandri]
MSSPNPEEPPTPTGLRAQFHHLLPRHALFQVRIHIHQLASVPLVHGQFGVKWKFKNTQKVKGKSKSRGPGPEPDGDGDSFGSGDTSPAGEASPPDPPPPLLGAQSRSQSASDSGIFDADYEQDATSTRGQTPWLPLLDHSVSWDQSLSAVVQMSIDRDTQRLLPHPFKLKVMQRVIAGDLDAPHNPQLGVVELNLAEYVDSVPLSTAATGSVPSKGVVTRRYLLSDSKTNATLRLSIRVEPLGASPPFTAPPLPNGEILAGVSSFLSTQEDVYRTRPRALDLYAPVEPSPHRTPLFDVRALPLAYGPRPTESLIDALFNPAPVHDERLVSPFTRLVPDGSDSFLSASYSASSGASFLSESTSSADTASVYSAHGSLVPSSSGANLSPGGAEGRAHRWWQRNNRDRSRSRSRSRAPSVAVA